jgi:hypothetical protein
MLADATRFGIYAFSVVGRAARLQRASDFDTDAAPAAQLHALGAQKSERTQRGAARA